TTVEVGRTPVGIADRGAHLEVGDPAVLAREPGQPRIEAQPLVADLLPTAVRAPQPRPTLVALAVVGGVQGHPTEKHHPRTGRPDLPDRRDKILAEIRIP